MFKKVDEAPARRSPFRESSLQAAFGLMKAPSVSGLVGLDETGSMPNGLKEGTESPAEHDML